MSDELFGFGPCDTSKIRRKKLDKVLRGIFISLYIGVIIFGILYTISYWR